jgi:hypothetical protein
MGRTLMAGRDIRKDGGRYWLYDLQKEELDVSSDAFLHL